MHRFEFLPGDGFKIAFTEMVMQSGRGLDLAYANPVSKHGEIPLPLGMGRDSRPACAGNGTLSGLVR